jgi:sugar lactone lactonase YvrE
VLRVDSAVGLSNQRVWAEFGPGSGDGICLDTEGAIWSSARRTSAGHKHDAGAATGKRL